MDKVYYYTKKGFSVISVTNSPPTNLEGIVKLPFYFKLLIFTIQNNHRK